jgi:hypothetical protein
MGIPPAYVKKSICLSAASLMDFSKLAVFQVYLEDRPSLFGPFVAMTKGQAVIFPLESVNFNSGLNKKSL